MYYNGLGVEKDWNRARELYRQAAMTNKNAEALLKELEEDERKMNESKPEEWIEWSVQLSVRLVMAIEWLGIGIWVRIRWKLGEDFR